MIALVSAALLAVSAISPVPVADRPASVVNYFGMEDIVPTSAPGPVGYVLVGEASLTVGGSTITYDLAGRKSNGDLSYASPRKSGVRKWNWYSTGMFSTVTWF